MICPVRWKTSVWYKVLSAALSYNNSRKIRGFKQANACTRNHWRAWECLNCTRVKDNITEPGRSKQTSLCTASKPLSHTSFCQSIKRDQLCFFFSRSTSLLMYLTSVHWVQKMAGIVSHSSHSLILTVTRHCAALSHCCLNYWSTQVQRNQLTSLSFPWLWEGWPELGGGGLQAKAFSQGLRGVMKRLESS